MSDIKIRESKLPGVGVEHDFQTELGERIGVISHHSGRRDLLLFDKDDPDFCRLTLQLTEGEGRLLGQLMGASQVVETMSSMQQNIGGLAIDWIPISDRWSCVGETLAELALTKTGIIIAAVIRGEETFPVPGADFRLYTGDTVVVIGTPEGIRKASTEMRGEDA